MRIVGAAFVAAGVLLLAGCGGGGEPAPAASSSSTATAGHSTADTVFLTHVRETVKGADDADLIRQARDACHVMTDSGATQLDAASRLVASGFDTGDAAAIVTAAVKAYCPGAKAY